MKKSLGLVAAVALLASLFSGCSAQNTPTFVAGTHLTIGFQAPLKNLNAGVATDLPSQSAAQELAYLTMPSFFTADELGNLTPNLEFGTVKLLGGNKVSFELTGKAKWSDGKPVTGQDLELSVLAATSKFEPESLTGFESSLRFTSLATAQVSKVSDRGITLKYRQVPADWQTNLPVTVASHLLNPSGGELNTSSVAAAYSAKTAFENQGVRQKVEGKYLVSAGAYKIVKASESQVSLVHNPDFNWGPSATIDTLKLKFFPNANGLLKALNARQIDLAAPVESATASRDQIKEAMKSAGGETTSGIGTQNESVLLNHGLGSAFNSATYNGDSKKSKFLASAFVSLIPRAGIYSTLLSNSALNKTDSFAFDFGSSEYSSSVQQNGTATHQFQNAELAQEKWQKAGFERTIKIRVLFDSDNPRGQLEYSQLAQWGKVSGFTIQNVSTQNVYDVLNTGAWDVYLATHTRFSHGFSSVSQLTGALNGLEAKEIQPLLSKLSKNPVAAEQAATLSELEKLLISNYVGLPLFELPRTVYCSKKLADYKPSLNQQFATWGYPYWSVSASGK